MNSIVQKPWGYYEILKSGKKFLVKKLFIKPGGMLSLQNHEHRSEHWLVAEGEVEVTLDKKTINLVENENIFIYTYLNVKENLMELYGFMDLERRSLFLNLIDVSGIGPRTAINLLSNASVSSFKDNIVSEDVKSLSLIPGIGPKTAKRIILDIKEKITSTPISTQNLDNDKLDFCYDDIYTALSSLGYKKSQIDKAVKKLNDEGSYEGDIENVIKRILAIIR